jgi:putative hydrolase of the HAD superfamily
MTVQQQEIVFQRIYSVFGSQAAYERFDDALPFLHWADRNNIMCGLLSNADDRYGMLCFWSCLCLLDMYFRQLSFC